MAKKLSRPTQGERERLNKRLRIGASFGIKRCKMKTYGGFFIMAGPAPRGVKPEKCQNSALANGFCEKHNPDNW